MIYVYHGANLFFGKIRGEETAAWPSHAMPRMDI